LLKEAQIASEFVHCYRTSTKPLKYIFHKKSRVSIIIPILSGRNIYLHRCDLCLGENILLQGDNHREISAYSICRIKLP